MCTQIMIFIEIKMPIICSLIVLNTTCQLVAYKAILLSINSILYKLLDMFLTILVIIELSAALLILQTPIHLAHMPRR